ncbi:unnamed protein product [Sphenostylis stenocarpa]|uniref:Uncharacterized protein n=1 Tax=Sphenostylis stenocarpa TaxID=92480 RepID=A0AA86SM32_9FABA|nr:unnamed protein product [Sphenostylis stenocarpa]
MEVALALTHPKEMQDLSMAGLEREAPYNSSSHSRFCIFTMSLLPRPRHSPSRVARLPSSHNPMASFILSHPQNQRAFFSSPLWGWIRTNLHHPWSSVDSHEKDAVLFAAMVWLLWKDRKSWVCDGRSFSSERVLQRVATLAEDYGGLVGVEHSSPTTVVRYVSWCFYWNQPPSQLHLRSVTQTSTLLSPKFYFPSFKLSHLLSNKVKQISLAICAFYVRELRLKPWALPLEVPAFIRLPALRMASRNFRSRPLLFITTHFKSF